MHATLLSWNFGQQLRTGNNVINLLENGQGQSRTIYEKIILTAYAWPFFLPMSASYPVGVISLKFSLSIHLLPHFVYTNVKFYALVQTSSENKFSQACLTLSASCYFCCQLTTFAHSLFPDKILGLIWIPILFVTLVIFLNFLMEFFEKVNFGKQIRGPQIILAKFPSMHGVKCKIGMGQKDLLDTYLSHDRRFPTMWYV